MEEKINKKDKKRKSTAKSNSKKLGWFQTFNPDAGNVPYNISMFNQGFGYSMSEDLEDISNKVYNLLNYIDSITENRYDLLNYFLSTGLREDQLNEFYNFIIEEGKHPKDIYDKLEEYELDSKIITEGFEDTIKKS